MALVLAAIGALIGVLGWLWSTPPKWVRTVAILLLVVAAIFEYRAREYEHAQLSQTGLLRPTGSAIHDGDYPKIEIGNSGTVFVFSGDPSLPFMRILQDCELSIRRVDGVLKVSSTIRDRYGAVVAEIVDNEWRVNSESSFDRNYRESALEVLDSAGLVVIQVVALPDRVQLQGIWYDADGNGVALSSAPKATGGAYIETTGRRNSQLETRIERIFRYPSDRHLGELR